MKYNATNHPIKGENSMKKKSYYLLNEGEVINKGDEIYAQEEITDEMSKDGDIPKSSWEAVPINWIGQQVDSIHNEPIRRYMKGA